MLARITHRCTISELLWQPRGPSNPVSVRFCRFVSEECVQVRVVLVQEPQYAVATVLCCTGFFIKDFGLSSKTDTGTLLPYCVCSLFVPRDLLAAVFEHSNLGAVTVCAPVSHFWAGKHGCNSYAPTGPACGPQVPSKGTCLTTHHEQRMRAYDCFSHFIRYRGTSTRWPSICLQPFFSR